MQKLTLEKARSDVLAVSSGLAEINAAQHAKQVQRCGSAMKLNIHFHMIFLDGVYLPVAGAPPAFRHAPAPTATEFSELVLRSPRASFGCWSCAP